MNVRMTNELSDSLYMFIASVLSCCKIVTLLINRRAIKVLSKKLEEEPCKPMNEEEVAIQKKFDKSIGSITIYYTFLVELTVVCMILSSLFTDFKDQKLAYRAWLPFDYSALNYYYVAYAHQIVALVGTSLLNVACDVIVCGYFVHVCSQLEIFKYRLKCITKERKPDIGKIVRFHDYLYGLVSLYHSKYAFTVRKKFRSIISIQLLSSTLVVCFILYELTSTSTMSSKYLQFVLYLACMMTQIFFYCWYGNQLKLKSGEVVSAIFEMDWILLDNSSKKSLIIIMRRAMNPIELSCAYIFTMDLNTFVGILKMSYSAHNLLQRTKEPSLCGCWRPLFSSPLAKFAYTTYRYYALIVVNVSAFCEIMDLILNVRNEDDFCDNIYVTMGISIGCHKMYTLLVSRKNIIIMEDMLKSEPFQPETEEEVKIRNKCYKQVRLNAILYATLVEMAMVSVSISGILKPGRYSLPYRAWIPYNYSSLSTHIFIYVHQMLSMAIGAMSHAALDTLIWSLLMYTHNQIEIFECRLKKIERNERDIIKLCVRYHNLVYRFATKINDEFKMVIFIQFMMSILLICIRLYMLTTMKLSPEKILETFCYCSSILVQIYIFCWYGNEVKLKSLAIPSMIFDIDWMVLDKAVKRDLLMIMMRAMSPIEMTSGHIMTMNLESFGAILKTSYSSYNLLQSSQEH
ncbi:odorant receptor 4-like [Xylocopa sonorina]|uniref:odorant receptor 4-like n=1 Tax=Xylocopa sonorina TaxID=1818115 RepID=UPI00403AC1DC